MVMSIPIGDMVIDKRMSGDYEVTEHIGHGKVRAERFDGKVKTFNVNDLECIDADDGLWQEMES
jgi:hypothetical protein